VKKKKFSLKFQASVIGIGTSSKPTLYLQLPMALLENYKIKKGDSLTFIANANGLYLAVKQRKTKRRK